MPLRRQELVIQRPKAGFGELVKSVVERGIDEPRLHGIETANIMLLNRIALIDPFVKMVVLCYVEVDETYIGGKEKNKHANKRTPGSQGRGSSKTKETVVAIVQCHGKVRAFHVNDSTKTTLHRLIG